MSWASYKNVTVPSSATGDAGVTLTNDIKVLADGIPYSSSTDPSASNDTTQGYEYGSLWFNTTTSLFWQCVSPATGAAVWVPYMASAKPAVACVINQPVSGTYNNGAAGQGATFTFSSTGPQPPFNGVTLALNTIVLLNAQASGPQNGLYVVTTVGATGVACVLTRHPAMDVSGKYVGATFFVGAGDNIYGAEWFSCANVTEPTVGTTTITSGRNKQISINVIPWPTSITYSTTITPAAGGQNCSINVTLLTGNITISNPTQTGAGRIDGGLLIINLVQDATGGHVVTYGSLFAFGSTYTLASAWGTGATTNGANAKLTTLWVYNQADSKYRLLSAQTGF
jgi:hypothetical protein